ncbi:JAB domain-containing protein [Proteiniborus ethanoligenes]|uniref:JAB domain-containing protein n=1 Tax=Proteiniborus ethanoligenes TaxID=415015 RepID=UPI003139C63A
MEIAANYIKNFFIGRTNEFFYCICLDSQLKVVFPALISEGTIKETAETKRGRA